MKTVVFTSDTHNWLLKGFFHQWDKYAQPGEVEVAGFTNPDNLPDYARFVSIGDFKDYPVEHWSDAIIKYLEGIDDELILFLLEDYWLIRKVNDQAMGAAHAFMMEHPNVVRFDVAADRMFARGAVYVGSSGILDICEAKGEYSSIYAGIYLSPKGAVRSFTPSRISLANRIERNIPPEWVRL